MMINKHLLSLSFQEHIAQRLGNARRHVEVKAENGRAKSLKTLINSDKYADIKFGVKLFNGNVGYSDNVYSFPYFCAFLLKEFLQTK